MGGGSRETFGGRWFFKTAEVPAEGVDDPTVTSGLVGPSPPLGVGSKFGDIGELIA